MPHPPAFAFPFQVRIKARHPAPDHPERCFGHTGLQASELDLAGAANPRIHRVDRFPGPSGYTPFVEACVRASAGIEEPPLTADDSLRALQTVFGCYQAAETGCVQRIGI